jgi:tRNA A-37 threonylcarbamoyl transferase component Bud32
VSLTSADNCFLILAKRLKLIDRAQSHDLVSQAFETRSEEPILMEDLAIREGCLNKGDTERILKLREQYGRCCRTCKHTTYLLPDQKSKRTPCELCHSQLIETKRTASLARGELGSTTTINTKMQSLSKPGLDSSNEWRQNKSNVAQEAPLFVDKESQGSSKEQLQALQKTKSDSPGDAPAEQAKGGGEGQSDTQLWLETRNTGNMNLEKNKHQADAKKLDNELIGLVLDGYRVVKQIAHGGMGALYLARHPIINKQIVIKTLFPRHSQNGTRLQRFIREARAASQLDHPNIVPVINIAQYREGYFYLSMPYIQGSNLDELVREGGALGVEKALISSIEVASALAMAHDNDIIHRDIKPNNLLVDVNGVTKVTDFGLAKVLGSQDKLTKPGMFVGTPLYMAPEVGRSRPLDGRVDIYGLGLTLYYMLTASHAFQRATVADLMMQRAHKRIPHPKVHGVLLSDSVLKLLGHTLAVDRDQRYGTMQDLIIDLKAALAGETLDLPDPTIFHEW